MACLMSSHPNPGHQESIADDCQVLNDARDEWRAQLNSRWCSENQVIVSCKAAAAMI